MKRALIVLTAAGFLAAAAARESRATTLQSSRQAKAWGHAQRS